MSSEHVILPCGGRPAKIGAMATNEHVWWEAPDERISKGGGAGGGGVSVVFKQPQWQNRTVKSLNEPSIDGRILPKVAAPAGPFLYDLIFMGRDFPNGGNSASTPLWSALITRIDASLPANLQQRFFTSLRYGSAKDGRPRSESGCIDIKIGQNASHPEPDVGYQAEAGFTSQVVGVSPTGRRYFKCFNNRQLV